MNNKFHKKIVSKHVGPHKDIKMWHNEDEGKFHLQHGPENFGVIRPLINNIVGEFSDIDIDHDTVEPDGEGWALMGQEEPEIKMNHFAKFNDMEEDDMDDDMEDDDDDYFDDEDEEDEGEYEEYDGSDEENEEGNEDDDEDDNYFNDEEDDEDMDDEEDDDEGDEEDDLKMNHFAKFDDHEDKEEKKKELLSFEEWVKSKEEK